MSTERDKTNSIRADEKFIADLYAQLNEDGSPAVEQPSASLDTKILAAAHQSVNSDAIAISTAKKSNHSTKISRAWYMPVSIAASTILAVSLILNQSNDLLIGAEPDVQYKPQPSNDMISSTTDTLLADSEASNSLLQAQYAQAIQIKKQHISAEKIRTVEKSARTLAYTAKKRSPRVTTEHAMVNEMLVSASQSSVVAPKLSAINDNGIELSSHLSTNVSQNKTKLMTAQPTAITVTPWLSTAQYQVFLQEKRFWALEAENDASYTITVFNNAEVEEKYMVSKGIFSVTTVTGEQTVRHSFNKIHMNASH